MTCHLRRVVVATQVLSTPALYRRLSTLRDLRGRALMQATAHPRRRSELLNTVDRLDEMAASTRRTIRRRET